MSDPVEQFFSGGAASPPPASYDSRYADSIAPKFSMDGGSRPGVKQPMAASDAARIETLLNEHAKEQKTFIDLQAAHDNPSMRRSLDNLDQIERELRDRHVTPPPRTVKIANAELPPDPTSDFLNTGKTPPAPAAAPEKTARNPSLLHDVTSLGAPIVGGWRGITELGSRLLSGESLRSATEAAGAATNDYVRDHTYEAPLVKETAINRGAAYPELTPGALLAKGADIAGEKASDVTGSPAAGATVRTGVQMLPMLLGPRGMAESKATPRPTVPPVAEPIAPRQTVPTAETVPTGTPPTPVAPEMTIPQDKAPTAPISAATPTESMPAGQVLPTAAQTERAQVLRDVGFQDARQAAIEGDHRTRAVEYQMTRFDEPAGQAAAKSFANEQQVMGNHVRNLIKESGGSVGMDQDALYSRGQAIVRPIQALKKWFDGKASELYKAADEKAAGQPVSLDGFKDTIGDQSHWTNSDRVFLKDAALSYAKKVGMNIAEDGSISGNALQAETMRKWLNEQRTASNGKFVDALKDSLDEDAGKAAGGPIYDQARALWKARQETLADPKGISSLLEEEGTNRAVPFHKIPGNITKMEPDQFAHIVKTLRDMPPEVQPLANQALGEIKSQFYNQMLKDATETRGGTERPYWNGTAIKNAINANSRHLSTVMSPEELSKIDALRKAGDILSFDPSYPGAAAQAANAVKHGLMSNMARKALTGAGAATGGFLFGLPGAAAGAALGEAGGARAATAIGEKQALRRWGAKSVPLNKLMEP